ncbi:MAG TPA: fatty acid hydroxylase family protein [Blastocatellia bacterium]|nr:fatty acid hydroxylase family protein [Blastocatellia bacterium]
MVPAAITSYRVDYRSANVSPRYSGVIHFLFTSTVCLGIMAYAILHVSHVTGLQLLTVPITFMYANLVEYLGHRGPMHRKTGFLSIIFERHALQHHSFFTHDAMECESPRDYKMILFPPIMIVFFFGLFAVPIGFLIRYALGANVALLFVTTSVGYFLNYEWLHWLYHQSPDSFFGRLPFIGGLRRHHFHHHNKMLMGRYNFNITYPICDRLLGTTYRQR